MFRWDLGTLSWDCYADTGIWFSLRGIRNAFSGIAGVIAGTHCAVYGTPRTLRGICLSARVLALATASDVLLGIDDLRSGHVADGLAATVLILPEVTRSPLKLLA
jgi:hypothetical protein